MRNVIDVDDKPNNTHILTLFSSLQPLLLLESFKQLINFLPTLAHPYEYQITFVIASIHATKMPVMIQCQQDASNWKVTDSTSQQCQAR